MLKPTTKTEKNKIFALLTLLFRWRMTKALISRLVCAFVVCRQQSQGFSHRGSYDVEVQASWPPPGYAPEPN